MAKDLSNQTWHGVPRKEIPWFPKIDNDACIGCDLCYLSCGREVFEKDEENRVEIVERPYNCPVGCSTCKTVCPVEAISFPDRETIWKVEKEHRIFGIVKKEAKEKREKIQIQRARIEAEAKIAMVQTRVKIEVAGHFGEKYLPRKLHDMIADKPFDIVNFQMQVPTMKGADEGAPCFSSFEIVSTEQKDIAEFANEVRSFIKEKGIVLVSETKM